jgi:hypothetical protein
MAIDYENGFVHFRKRPRGDYRGGTPGSEPAKLPAVVLNADKAGKGAYGYSAGSSR